MQQEANIEQNVQNILKTLNIVPQQQQTEKNDVATIIETKCFNSKSFTLIQCFYGTNFARIEATKSALRYMLCLDPKPDEWIFIEAQKSKTACQFAWLKEHNIKYKFIKTTDKNEFIPLKSALWNIGADLAKNDLLAFVDADCYFLDLAWANTAKEALNKYDFCSLAQYNIYDENPSELLETVGSKWLSVKDKDEKTQFGHCGFTFGAKKPVFNAICRMETLPALEDIYMWTKIFGPEHLYNKKELFNGVRPPMLKFDVGAAKGNCVHVFHRTYSKDNYIKLLQVARQLGGRFPGVDTSKKLPCWTNTREAQAMRNALQKVQAKDENKTCLLEDFKEEYAEKDPIDICYITDNNYVQHTLVSIASLVTNKYPTTKCKVHVVCDNVDDSKKQLFKAFARHDVEMQIVDYNDNAYTKKKQELGKYISAATYIRLELPSIFPKIKKLLYLDGDTIVQDDLCELFNIDLKNAVIAGTSDIGICIDSLKWDKTDYVRKTLPSYETEYVNAGVLLLDLARLRQIEFEKTCKKLYDERKDFIFADQDIINFALFGKKKLFPIYWNCPIFSLYLNYGNYDAEQLKSRIQQIYHVEYNDIMDIAYKAKIVHLNGDKAHINDTAYLSALYDRYFRIAMHTCKIIKT